MADFDADQYGFLGAFFNKQQNASDFNFKVKPSDYLGADNEAFKSDMMQLALASPTEYFKLRKVVLERVKARAVNQQYAIYYFLMTNGNATDATNSDAGTSIVSGAGLQPDTVNMFKPNVARQDVNTFALKAAKTIDAIAEECVEILLPMNYKKIAEDRQVQKTAGTLGFAPP